jgi:hypothetical protein
MASERQNMSEQEISIKAREHELYVPDSDPNAKTVKPFAVYLRETPAEPLSLTTKAILWTVGTAVALLFLAACWRAAMHHAPASSVKKTRPAKKTAMLLSPFVSPMPASTAQAVRGCASGTRACNLVIDDDAKYYPLKGSTHDDLFPDLSERPGFEREPDGDSDAIIGPGAS